VTPPANGVLSGDGPTFTYTPAANFHGSDSFTFRVNDGSHDSNVSTVSIAVNAVNDMPTAESQSVSTNSNTPVAVVLAGSDVETAAANLVFEVTVAPQHGTLSGSDANLTYSPDANYSGPDSFNFTVRDTGDDLAAAATSAGATVSITVNDTLAPTVTAPSRLGVITGDGATTCGAIVTDEQLGNPIAADNSGNVTVERTGVPAGNVFPVGSTTITYTATDAAGNSTRATQIVTVTDSTAPSITAPAPTSVNAGLSGQAAIPNVLAGTVASDNCGPVTLSQSPVAGTLVGVGTHTITITATDSAGNTSTATTTFTVNGGGLTFAFRSPGTAKQGKLAKLDATFFNTTGEKLLVSYVVRYSSPCGTSGVADSGGPLPLNAGTNRDVNFQFHIPKDACTGLYSMVLEVSVNGVLVGTTDVQLLVTP
jgi:hypothetical protein